MTTEQDVELTEDQQLIYDALIAEHDPPANEVRRTRIRRAITLGASPEVLAKLCLATRTSTTSTIVLPALRYENLSRGRGWARKGKGDSAQWGDRVDGGYRVGPGRWVVGATDGFSRKDSQTWDVEHIQVGPETWTVA